MANSEIELGEVDATSEIFQFLLPYEEKGHRLSSFFRPIIFRVPSVQRDINPSCYDPKVVSIGPLHRKAKNLEEMEALKAAYVHNLLGHLGLPIERALEACAQKVTASINQIKRSYDGMKSCTDVELSKMMVIDGLFILEFVYNFGRHRSDVLLTQSIVEDLVLLENQIPFFVLQDLFDCTIKKCKPGVSLNKLILDVLLCVPLFQPEFRKDNDLRTTAPDHILSLLHICHHPAISIPPKFADSDMHSAIELDRAGVKFKRIQDPSWPMAIEVERSRFGCFSWSCGKPTLRMPVMYLNDFTESITRNLIVYEQSSSRAPNYITSYISALDNLVDTKEDIAILMESGVLTNLIGSNEEAASIINRIRKKIHSTDFFYGEQWNEINRYYNGYWPKNIASLRRTYFSSPWNIIALLAGIVLFALTIVQTIKAF